MVKIETYFCDECGIRLSNNQDNELLIFSISYWSIKEYKVIDKDFLLKNNIAKMFCSPKCIGDYISRKIKGEKKNE